MKINNLLKGYKLTIKNILAKVRRLILSIRENCKLFSLKTKKNRQNLRDSSTNNGINTIVRP